MKIDNFWGDLTDISAKKEALSTRCGAEWLKLQNTEILLLGAVILYIMCCTLKLNSFGMRYTIIGLVTPVLQVRSPRKLVRFII